MKKLVQREIDQDFLSQPIHRRIFLPIVKVNRRRSETAEINVRNISRDLNSSQSFQFKCHYRERKHYFPLQRSYGQLVRNEVTHEFIICIQTFNIDVRTSIFFFE
jgi:hypothetical protein